MGPLLLSVLQALSVRVIRTAWTMGLSAQVKTGCRLLFAVREGWAYRVMGWDHTTDTPCHCLPETKKKPG